MPPPPDCRGEVPSNGPSSCSLCFCLNCFHHAASDVRVGGDWGDVPSSFMGQNGALQGEDLVFG